MAFEFIEEKKIKEEKILKKTISENIDIIDNMAIKLQKDIQELKNNIKDKKEDDIKHIDIKNTIETIEILISSYYELGQDVSNNDRYSDMAAYEMDNYYYE